MVERGRGRGVVGAVLPSEARGTDRDALDWSCRTEQKKKIVSAGPPVVSPAATLGGSRRGSLVAPWDLRWCRNFFFLTLLVFLLDRVSFWQPVPPRDRDTDSV